MYTINSRHYDGGIRRSWICELIEHKESLLVFRGVFEFDIDHPDLGHLETGTISYEYYWLDRWYNVFRFHHPDGRFRNYYCNINMPPTLNSATLDYVDLDLDILVGATGSFRVLDEDEYAENAYPEEVRLKAGEAVAELKEMITKSRFPFDFVEQNR